MKELNKIEQITASLRHLYNSYGYVRYNMSKFEEYDIYVKNKDFLVSDNIITFNDTNGKLLALKPDVTISIAKNYRENGESQKVYYDENVYRVSDSTHSYKEIRQAGLECMGKVSAYEVVEVTALALLSLENISSDYILDISHIGIISNIFKKAELDEILKKQILSCMAQKNIHELGNICLQNGIDEKFANALKGLVSLPSEPEKAFECLDGLCEDGEGKKALDELKNVYFSLKSAGFTKMHIDFSVINDISYYSGIVFRGFVKSVSGFVLSGGEYGKLMQKMGKNAQAVGFAVYLDLLERLGFETKEHDFDTVYIYDDTVPCSKVLEAIKKASVEGKTVRAVKDGCKEITAKQTVDLR